jgi:hypothetical protein
MLFCGCIVCNFCITVLVVVSYSRPVIKITCCELDHWEFDSQWVLWEFFFPVFTMSSTGLGSHSLLSVGYRDASEGKGRQRVKLNSTSNAEV